MWQRFTERARKVIFYSQQEAHRKGSKVVDTEHLLLGLIHENDNLAARLLDKVGVNIAKIRAELEPSEAQIDDPADEKMQIAPLAKHVIDLAYEEARDLSNDYIGTEHLLLGLIRESDGVAGKLLAKLGVTVEQIRSELGGLQGDSSAASRAVPAFVRGEIYTSVMAALSRDLVNAMLDLHHGKFPTVLSDDIPAVKIVRQIMRDAVARGSSDIVWMELNNVHCVYFLIGADWTHVADLQTVAPAIISVLRMEAGVSPIMSDQPETGTVRFEYKGKTQIAHTVFLPETHQEKILMHIVESEG